MRGLTAGQTDPQPQQGWAPASCAMCLKPALLFQHKKAAEEQRGLSPCPWALVPRAANNSPLAPYRLTL